MPNPERRRKLKQSHLIFAALLGVAVALWLVMVLW